MVFYIAQVWSKYGKKETYSWACATKKMALKKVEPYKQRNYNYSIRKYDRSVQINGL